MDVEGAYERGASRYFAVQVVVQHSVTGVDSLETPRCCRTCDMKDGMSVALLVENDFHQCPDSHSLVWMPSSFPCVPRFHVTDAAIVRNIAHLWLGTLRTRRCSTSIIPMLAMVFAMFWRLPLLLMGEGAFLLGGKSASSKLMKEVVQLTWGAAFVALALFQRGTSLARAASATASSASLRKALPNELLMLQVPSHNRQMCSFIATSWCCKSSLLFGDNCATCVASALELLVAIGGVISWDGAANHRRLIAGCALCAVSLLLVVWLLCTRSRPSQGRRVFVRSLWMSASLACAFLACGAIVLGILTIPL
jgi:hypothetical protein